MTVSERFEAVRAAIAGQIGVDRAAEQARELADWNYESAGLAAVNAAAGPALEEMAITIAGEPEYAAVVAAFGLEAVRVRIRGWYESPDACARALTEAAYEADPQRAVERAAAVAAAEAEEKADRATEKARTIAREAGGFSLVEYD